MKPWLFICILICSLATYIATPASLLGAPAQQAEIVLQLRNEAEQTICSVYIAPITATEWGQDWLSDATITPGEVYEFSLVPGDYDLLLQDCDGNPLLDKRRLTIKRDHELSLTQADVSTTACNARNQSGVQAYQRGQYAVALAALQSALSCYRTVGDRAGEGTILNGIGLVYTYQGRYGEALTSYAQALSIAQEVGDRVTESAILNNMAGVYANQGRYSKALENFEQVLAIVQAVGDRSGEETTLNNIALVNANLGRYSEALTRYQQALAIMQATGDRKKEGGTLNNIGTVYHNQGRYDEALTSYMQALAIMQSIGDRAGAGATLSNIAWVYSSQGRYGKALTSYEQALAIAQAVGNRAGEGAILNGIGLVYTAQGRYDEALTSYEQALSIAQAVGNRDIAGVTFNNVGIVYNAQGQYGEALASFQQSLVIRREVGDLAGEGTTLNNIAGVYDAQGRYGEALASYEQALTIRREVGDPAGEGATLNGIGLVYANQGRYDEALTSYEQALSIMQSIGDRTGEGATLNNIGAVYHAQRRYGEALASYEQTLTIRQEVGDRAGEGETLNNIGAIYHAQGRHSEALTSFQQALEILQAVDNRREKGITVINMGVVYNGLGRSSEALQAYIEGIELLDTVRSEAGIDVARTSVAEDFATIYSRVISFYHTQGAPEQAFWYSERGRARTLLDLMATGQVQLSDNEATTLLAAEQETYATRQSAQDTLAKAHASISPDPALVSEAEQALKVAEATYQKVSDEITARSDQLVSLIPGRQKVFQLADVQALLDNDTTLLSYWMLEDKTLTFLITADSISVFELLGATVDNVSTTLRSLYGWSNKENPHPRPLRNLYQWLVEPLAVHLHTPYITIIPHQVLHYVPFAALTDGKVYFGQQYTLSLLPSASVLPFLAQNAAYVKEAATPTALVFGNPQTSLPTLPAAETEATAVAKLLHTAVYTGTAASELTLHSMISGTTILHLAAHGSFSPTNALASAIYLAPVQPLISTQPLPQTAGIASMDTTRDGWLETREIFGLPLQGTDLVTLSACQTSIGELSLGDDIVGLTRAFFFAGAPTVIASLWSVDDAATAALMVSFYKHWLQDGMSKAQALQAAQADVRREPQWASPFYWASFVLHGDPGASGEK